MRSHNRISSGGYKRIYNEIVLNSNNYFIPVSTEDFVTLLVK